MDESEESEGYLEGWLIDDLTGEQIKLTAARRVTVVGIHKYDEHDRICEIVVERIEVFGKGLALEGLGQINITDGMESSEYVRRLRDEG